MYHTKENFIPNHGACFVNYLKIINIFLNK